MKQPNISVIMPAYNHDSYIGEAIESVINQTYDDFEFIIIDDGSTDKTKEVVQRYNNPRIKFLEQENKGAHAALNRGVSIAQGNYISILNSDDYYDKERLAYLVEIAKSENASFIITGLDFVDEASKPVNNRDIWHVAWYDMLLSLYRETKSLQATFLRGNIAATTSNFFYDAELPKKIGGFEPYKYCHDYDYALRALIEYKEKFLFIDDKNYLSYRLHSDNTVKESAYELNKETFEFLTETIPAFIDNNKDRRYMTEALENIKQLNTHMINPILYELNIKGQEIQNNNQEIQNKDQIIRGMENSMSWRLTAHIRWLYAQYLKITGKN